MRRSIRGRLQAWYAIVLLATVGGFAFIVFTEAHAGRYREVDAALESGINYLDAGLRRLPASDLAPRGGGGPGGGPIGFAPPPGAPRPAALPVSLPPKFLGEGFYFGVWLADGSTLKSDDLPDDAPMPAVASSSLLVRPRISSRGVYREAVMAGPSDSRILVGRSTQEEDSRLRRFTLRLVLAAAGALAIGLTGGWLVSARIFQPIAAISATASRISVDNLSERINEDRVDQELQELASVMNRMFARLEAAFARQAQFTADASHELRTPLAVIRSHAELALARPRDPEEYREALRTCQNAAERMALLVDGLLTLARADAGRLELRREPVQLAAMVEEVIDQLRPFAAEKNVALHVEINPVVVLGDPLRLSQVVTNLINNAIHYNRKGGSVRISLRVDRGKALLSVADTGIGIPPEEQAYVFQRFYRADKARTRARGGSGLGLAICKGIIDAHGGEIGFESRPNVGSRFWVRLSMNPR